MIGPREGGGGRADAAAATDVLLALGVRSPTQAQLRAVHAARADIGRVLLGANEVPALAGLLVALTDDLDLTPAMLLAVGQHLERLGWQRSRL